MSLSVNSSNASNPYTYLQSLWQQASSQSTTASASDPLSQLIGALDQQSGGTSSSSSSTGTAASGGSLQFGPQTLQALFAMQADLSDSQSAASQVDGTANATGTASSTDSSQQAQTGQQTQHGRHHHGMGGGGQNPLDALLSQSDATSQTTTNSNGSSTTTITYADGSSVSMTTAPTSSDSSGTSSAASSSSSNATTAGAASVTGANFIEQLIQMQAQLLNTTTPQSIMTV